MSAKVAIIGEADLVFPFSALGIQVYSPKNIDEARALIRSLAEKEISLCFLPEKYFQPLEKERNVLSKEYTPVIVGYSDYGDLTDRIYRRMREMAVKATGSDSLVK